MDSRSHIIALFFLIFALSDCLFSQADKFLFKNLTIDDGLSESTVHAIYQDSYGFMWFGTDAGLDKFDGYDFTNFQHIPSDSNSLSANFVVSILEDSFGTLWVGSGSRGLNLFNRENGSFKRIQHNPDDPQSLSNNDIRDIFEDSGGNIWIATSGGGLNLYNRDKDSFSSIKKKEGNKKGLGSNHISSIVEDSGGNLWLGSTEGVVTRFNPKDSTFFILDYSENIKGDLYNSTFGEVYVDSDNNIWYCSEAGLYHYNQITGKTKIYEGGDDETSLSSSSVSSIFEYQKGVYLISTDHGGLNILDTKTGLISKQFHSKFDQTSVSSNQLYSIYQSEDGIIWIGSFRGGVNYYDSKAYKFDQLKYLLTGDDRINCCGSVLGITEDPDGNIWLGFDGEGIKVFSHDAGIIQEYGPQSIPKSIGTSIVTSLFSDSKGDIWIGTYLDGMYQYIWETKTFKHFKHSPSDSTGLHGNNVWITIEENENTLWIGTMGEGLGLFSKNGHLIKHLKHEPGNENSLINNDVFSLFKDDDGNLWIGTRSGLDKYIPSADSIIHYTGENGPYGLWITYIYRDSKERLWVGSDVGLSLYKPEEDRFTHFTLDEGIPGKQFFNIQEDKHSNLWISSNQGLSRFDTENKTFRNYDINDGLQSSTFNYTTAFTDTKGRFYFGGTRGFNVFYPDSISDNQMIPNIYITGLTVLNKEVLPGQGNGILDKDVSLTESITLTHKQSVFSIRYAAINFTNTSKNRYRYKLEGFDENWISAGDKREVSYTNLNPGDYTFKVIASNNDGLWNLHPTHLHIEVLPPIWRTKWFLFLVVVFIILLILLGYYIRLKHLQNEKVVLTRKVKERTAQIEKQNEELEQHRTHLEKQVAQRTKELLKAKEKAEESDRLKSTFLANMSHEIRTPMNAIVGFSNLLVDEHIGMEEREEYVNLIGANSDTLLRLIEDILDLSLIEADQLVLRKTVFDLNDAVDNIFSTVMLSYNNSPFEIKKLNTVESEHLKIRTDKFRLSQILFNLLNNACKFTHEGCVQLLVKKEENSIVFIVSDTGIGIPKDQQENIFIRFRRHETKESDYRGIGLGLAISKRLSDLLGGELVLESEVGEGSKFTVSFPIDYIVEEDKPEFEIEYEISQPNWSGKSFLIVEDEQMNYLYLERALGKTKADITWVDDGKKAVELFESGGKFDVVLMDIRMPVMDGYEARKNIFNLAPEQVVIAQTAHARAEEEAKIRQAGFNGYIVKPIIINDLYRVIDQFMP